MTEKLITVDAQGRMIGTMDKMQAHLTGKLHRAFSVFIFNTDGQLLLQQRAQDKYHSGGKWTNTCCSHPRLGEDTHNAAHRRLQEEMGFDCELNAMFNFSYCQSLENGLIENEYDHVYFGTCNANPVPDASEVMAFKYVDMAQLALQLKVNPNDYTVWLNICFERVLEHYQKYIGTTIK